MGKGGVSIATRHTGDCYILPYRLDFVCCWVDDDNFPSDVLRQHAYSEGLCLM